MINIELVVYNLVNHYTIVVLFEILTWQISYILCLITTYKNGGQTFLSK